MGMTFIGVDVGGVRKGFHAVSLDRCDFERVQACDAETLADWCGVRRPVTIAVDSPIKWATSSNSRKCERDLQFEGRTIQCFRTPTRNNAALRDFYAWVRNGERLYAALAKRLPDCTVIETFPHAVHCFLEKSIDPRRGRSKVESRRESLTKLKYEISQLTNIDFVDAALCAHVAWQYLQNKVTRFGDEAEGYIYVPTA